MAGNVRMEWNMSGFAQVRSQYASGMVEAAAARIAAACGPGYAWSSQQGRGSAPRWRAIVYPDTFKAHLDNARNNTLVRNLG